MIEMEKIEQLRNCFNKSCTAGVLLFSFMCASLTYYIILNKGHVVILKDTTDQGGLVIKLSQGFVRAYSDFEAQYASGTLPNPAIFRSHALELADLNSLFGGSLHSEVIGLPGRAINTEPTDENMRIALMTLMTSREKKLTTNTLNISGEIIHRSIWPFYATDKTCVNCHNKIQNLNDSSVNRWQLGDLMGAQIVQKNISSQLNDLRKDSFWLSMLVFFATLAISYCFIFIYSQAFLTKQLKVLVTTDSMTGCINRREMYTRVAKLKKPVTGAILMLDIDKFKNINDIYGHGVGDVVIQSFASLVKGLLTETDWIARVGGEEFLVWLSDTAEQDASIIAEKIRAETQLSKVVIGDNELQYTVSIGLYTFTNAVPSQFANWVNDADKRLYKAKRLGRNRVESV
jgi:diguanylate cyclase (GGDEF)-like protein